ncbi:MAG: FlgO family outer membrane protein [Elusimicrobiota bacterium]
MNQVLTLTFLFLFPIQSGAQMAAPKAQTQAAEELKTLTNQLGAGVNDKPGIKLAVLEFAYTSGKASDGPVIIQERLTTLLAQNKKLILIERNLLKKVLGELNLQASGAIDEETTRKLGKLLGADAVITGTLNDTKDGETEINARVVETETGKILTAAGASVRKTWQDTPTVTQTGKNYDGKPLVQLAILLDTSNSMDGLINQARNQVWKIVNELNASEKSGSAPVIEVAVYEYGNSGLTAEKGWIRQVLPFTRNLDKVAEELFALKTNGGEEYCGQVIKNAVQELAWSKKDDAYKAIFIAGNEPFTQGATDFQQAVGLAKAKGIFVNTIFCGRRQEGLATQWLTAAQLSEGEYTNIDQSAPVAAINAPQDDQIAILSSKLNTTYVAYGSKGKAELNRKEALESNVARSGGASILSERAAFKASAPAAMADYESSWDIITAVESGAMKRSDIKKEQLPEELRKMDKAQLDKHIDSKLAERKKIKADIIRLQEERKSYIARQEKTQSGAPVTLDKAVIDAVHKQAVKKGYKFSR